MIPVSRQRTSALSFYQGNQLLGRGSMNRYRLGAHSARILLSIYLLSFCLNAGCGSGDGTSPEARLGIVYVDAEPDSVQIGWLLTGPSSFAFYGLGDDTLSGLAAGAYTMTWPEILGRVTPSPNPQSLLLGPGGTVEFTGHYAGIGELTVNVEPDFITAVWHLEGPGGLAESGTGDHVFTDMPEGDYLLLWGEQAGYRSPIPIQSTMCLGAGAAFAYYGQYIPIGALSVDPEPNEIVAPWRIIGPAGFQTEGLGDSTLTDLVAGCYTVEFLHRNGWVDPSPNSIVSCLAAGSSQVVQGIYSRAAPADEIALAFDPDGKHSCLDAEPFVQVTAYLLILAPSASGGVSGWECEVDYPGHAVLVGTALAGVNPLNVAQPPSFMVGLGGGPLPHAPVLELARLTFLLTSSDPILFAILPFTPCSLPDYELPVYADGADPSLLRPLTPRVIYGENVAAAINLVGCSPAPPAWGDIKKFYE